MSTSHRSAASHLVPWMAALALGAGLAGQEGLRQRPAVLQAAEADSAERELRTTPVVRAVQRAADSVVSIYLQTPQARGRRPITQGQGSGVILDETGLCITNWHVVAAALQADDRTLPIGIEVKLRDGRSRTAVVLSSSATHDLALLQMRLEADEKVKPIEIAHSAELMIGETLLAIGNPQGHANTVTVGVLSATGREIAVRSPDGQLREYKQLLQTDAAINQGNSGGALLDITGRLVGINNAMAVGAENIGFAIPIDLVREVFTKELVQSENFAVAADSPWLGIEVTDQGGQVVVAAVQAGSPAAKAGVERGDVLLRIDDQPLRSGLDYQRRLIDARLQRPLPLQLRRGTRELQIEAVPTTATHSLLLSLVGAEFEEIDTTRAEPVLRRATRAFYGTRGRPGEPMLPSTLRLAAVQAGSPAEALGLQPGDVVFAVTLVAGFREREHPILSARDLLQVLQQFQGRAVRISVLRGDEELTGLLEVRTPRRR